MGCGSSAAAVHAKYLQEKENKTAGDVVDLASQAKQFEATGNFERQKKCLDKAYKELEICYGEEYMDDHVDVAVCLVDLASAYGNLGDQAHELVVKWGSLDAKEIAKATKFVDFLLRNGVMPPMLDDVGHVEKVDKSLHRAVDGCIEKQRKSLQRSLAIRKRHYGPEHWQVGTTLFALGMACRGYDDIDSTDTCKKSFEAALRIKEGFYGTLYHPEIDKCFFNIGVACKAMGELPQAIEAFQQSLAIRMELYGESHAMAYEAQDQIDSTMQDLQNGASGGNWMT